MKASDSPPIERVAAVVHMRPRLAAEIRGAYLAQIPTPALVPPLRVGERLFLIEWIGAPTGRADLVHAELVEEHYSWVRRSWCWATGKYDTDLACVSLSVDPERAIPLIGDL